MKVIFRGKTLTLRDADFVASGGQGRVYARDDLAFKIFTDRSAVPPPGKLAELAAARCPEVVGPIAALTDPNGGACGYAMPRVRDAVSWAQLCTPALRARLRFDDAAALRLIAALRDTLISVHRLGLAIVDLSENNVLVQAGAPRIIDVDSWQTPSFPATALTPSIACPHAQGKTFTPATDWFSFGVLTFMLLVGVHPFKGKHPVIKGLAARMKAGLSVLDPAVRVPAMCRLDAIPSDLRQWYARVFATDHRDPPPRTSSLAVPVSRPRSPRKAHRFPASIEHVLVDRGRVFVATAFAAYEDEKVWHRSAMQIVAQGVAASGEPFVLERDADRSMHVTIRGAKATKLNVEVDAVTAAGPHVFVKVGARIDALRVLAMGARSIATLTPVTAVLPRAATLFAGACVQDLLGRPVASWLGHPRGAPQVELPSLTGHAIVDARREGDHFVALTSRSARLTAHTFTLNPDGSVASVSQLHDASPFATVFTTHNGQHVAIGPHGAPQGARTAQVVPPREIPDGAGLQLSSDGTTLVLTAGASLVRAPTVR